MTPDQFDKLVEIIARQDGRSETLERQVALSNQKLDRLFEELITGFPEANRVGKIRLHEERIAKLESVPRLDKDEIELIRKTLDVVGSWRWMGAILTGVISLMFVAVQVLERLAALWTNG